MEVRGGDGGGWRDGEMGIDVCVYVCVFVYYLSLRM